MTATRIVEVGGQTFDRVVEDNGTFTRVVAVDAPDGHDQVDFELVDYVPPAHDAVDFNLSFEESLTNLQVQATEPTKSMATWEGGEPPFRLQRERVG